jgi:hypothetical protein
VVLLLSSLSMVSENPRNPTDEAEMQALAVDVAGHAWLAELALDSVLLFDTAAVVDALVDAVSPACAPALAHLLGGGLRS